MQIEIATTPTPDIAEYVCSKDHGRLCHLPEWGQRLAEVFGHEPFYCVARDGGRLCGVLPLTLVRSRLFGNRMVSQAFSNYGGPLTDGPDSLHPLLARAVELAQENRCPVVELRNSERLDGPFSVREDKACMVLPLAGDPDTMWAGLKAEVRNRVRKARKAGLNVLHGGRELLDDFYEVWTVRMRQLGTPCYSRRLFEALLRAWPDRVRIFLVRHGHQALAAGFFHHFNGLVECRWAASRLEANRLAPNMLLYWSAIEYYGRAGQKSFDFGRSTIGSSQYEFKRRWGARHVQLHYAYWTSSSGRMPSLPRSDSPRYEKMVEIWKHLPLSVTRLLGPHVSRSLS